MKGFVFFVALLFVLCGTAFARNPEALESRLSYLKDIDAVSWVKFNGNKVIVGMKDRPNNIGSIVRGAALFGNRAYGFGVHVWAVPEKEKGWQSGSPYYCTATARHGKVQNSDCP